MSENVLSEVFFIKLFFFHTQTLSVIASYMWRKKLRHRNWGNENLCAYMNFNNSVWSHKQQHHREFLKNYFSARLNDIAYSSVWNEWVKNTHCCERERKSSKWKLLKTEIKMWICRNVSFLISWQISISKMIFRIFIYSLSSSLCEDHNNTVLFIKWKIESESFLGEPKTFLIKRDMWKDFLLLMMQLLNNVRILIYFLLLFKNKRNSIKLCKISFQHYSRKIIH